ncbi:MAG: hypothetical protein ACRDUY_03150, partial [Nitriliruptorales bacterium]
PGAEPLLVPRHVPGVSEVRTYLALPGVAADAAQVAARLASTGPVKTLLRLLLTLGPEGPSAARRQRTRWACVAEAVAPRAGGDDSQPPVARAWARGGDKPRDPVPARRSNPPPVARAWARGRDVYGLTGEIVALGADLLLREGPRGRGVAAPAEAFDARGFLDELAAVTSLRWELQDVAA